MVETSEVVRITFGKKLLTINYATELTFNLRNSVFRPTRNKRNIDS